MWDVKCALNKELLDPKWDVTLWLLDDLMEEFDVLIARLDEEVHAVTVTNELSNALSNRRKYQFIHPNTPVRSI
jgi:hypothetical protein